MRKSLVLCAIVALLVSVPAFTVLAEEIPTLRYGWQTGQTLAYRVEIQATNKEGQEILSGRPQFAVKSAGKDQAVLQLTGERLTSRKEAKPGAAPNIRPPRVPPFPRPGFNTVSGHELTLDARGRVVKESGQSSIPYLLGDLPDLILPKFPEQGEKTWKQSRELVIRVTQQGRIPSPFREDVELKRMNAEETVEYTLEASDEKSATLMRKYALKTVETIDGEPAIEVACEGKLVFDRVRGVPVSLEYSGKLVEREENSESRVPLKISISLLSPEEQQRLKAEAEAQAAALRAPPTPQERVQILESLQSDDFGKWYRAVQSLKQKQPKEPDIEVAGALAEQFDAADNNKRMQIAHALENWATDKEVPLLIRALDDGFQPIANSAMTTLARLKPAAAIDPLVKQLEKLGSRLSAAKTLKAYGAPAESAVQKALDNEEWTVRLEAVSILAEIGSAKSVEALQGRAENDSNALIRQRAKDAVDKLGKADGAAKP